MNAMSRTTERVNSSILRPPFFYQIYGILYTIQALTPLSFQKITSNREFWFQRVDRKIWDFPTSVQA